MTMLTAHFTLAELRCRDRHLTPVPAEYLDNARRLCEQLEVLRSCLAGAPIVITSCYRTAAHNTAIKAAKHSQHLTASAADICVRHPGGGSFSPSDVRDAIERAIQRGDMRDGGIGVYPIRPGRVRGWTHYDIGPAGR